MGECRSRGGNAGVEGLELEKECRRECQRERSAGVGVKLTEFRSWSDWQLWFG